MKNRNRTECPCVLIIILNWNGWRDTIECLESLYKITYSNYNVIVVDNDSEDESIEKIKYYCEGKIFVKSKYFKYDSNNKPIEVFEYFKEQIINNEKKKIERLQPNRKMILIKNDKNYGFAEGNNIAIRFALKSLNPDYILLLNNDTVVEKSFLTELLKTAERDSKVGIVGSKIYYYDYNGRNDVINIAGTDIILWRLKHIRYGLNKIDKGQFNKDRRVDKVEGSCMLIKKDLLNNIGLLDDKYFLYWEDTDFCYRAFRENYSVFYCHKAKIWHKITASSGGEFNPLHIYFMTRNMFLFIKKNAKTFDITRFLIYFLIYYFWYKSAVYLLYHHNMEKFFSFFRGVVDGVKTK